MTHAFTNRYEEFLDGRYDCVDRIVINAYLPGVGGGGGFRNWWHSLYGSEDKLDTEHLMRMAGRFSRRLRAWAKANAVPLIDCDRGARKHLTAEEYLAEHKVGRGLFLVLVGRAPGPVWEVQKTREGKIGNIQRKEPVAVCESLLFSYLGRGLGTRHDSHVRPSSLPSADPSQRSRICRLLGLLPMEPELEA